MAHQHHHPDPAPLSLSLLRLSAAQRLAMVGVLIGLIWAAVLWAADFL